MNNGGQFFLQQVFSEAIVVGDLDYDNIRFVSLSYGKIYSFTTVWSDGEVSCSGEQFRTP